jgi:hypothetical protein
MFLKMHSSAEEETLSLCWQKAETDVADSE